MKKIIFLLTSLLMFSFGKSQELVTNGNFETGNGNGWSGNAVNVVNLGGNYVNQANVTAIGNPWDVNLSYVLPLTQGKTYKLKFDAWTDNATGSRIMTAGIGLNEGPWTNINDPAVPLTSTPKTFTYNWVCPATSTNSRIIFDMGNALGYVFIDNVSLVEVVANPATDATLSDLKVDGTTVAGFSSNVTTYTLQYQQGTTTIPQITAATTTNASATKVITQASAIPGSAKVVVTSQDGTATKTYTINYTVSGPSVPAPTPPGRPVGDVISLFSDAYANIPVSEWSTSWDDSTIQEIMIAGNPTKKINFTNFLGVQLTNYVNASQMTRFHMDYYIDAGTDLVGKVINSKWSNHAAQAGETSSFILTHLPTTAGSWVSIDVPITDFSDAPQTRNSLYQYLLISNLGTVYVDNIYFHKGTLGVSGVNANNKSAKIYPNPVTLGDDVMVLSKVQLIEFFTTSGQKVKTSISERVNTRGLEKGLYIVKITSENGDVQSSKLIVK